MSPGVWAGWWDLKMASHILLTLFLAILQTHLAAPSEILIPKKRL